MAPHSNFRRALLLALLGIALWFHNNKAFLAGPGGPVPKGLGNERSAPELRSIERAAGVDAAAEPVTGESSITEEILAGISVAFSLLSKAIACSAIVGTGPLVGLWSSVALGFASLFGMRPGVVAGSAAVVVVPLGAFTAANGLGLVPLVVLLAAAIELVAGLVGFARTLDLVSKEVLAGFLNALGLALLVSQFGALSTPMGFALAAICAALTQFLPSAPIPSSLVGLAVATAVGLAFNFDVPTLAMKAKDPAAFAGGLAALPPFQLPQMPSMDDVQLALPCAISIAFISLIETLLAARVVDDRKCEDLCTFFYDENGELVMQGTDPETPLSVDVPTSTILSLAAGNGASVLLGGFGGAGLVPQTVLNLNSGGRGQWSIGSYAASMVIFALVLAPFVGQISVPALAGIMVQVSLDTIQFVPTFDAIKDAFEGKEEDAKIKLAILVITAVLCYQVDFAVGIVTGVALDKGAEALKLKKAS
ncbi:putative sulfate transporter YbaR [Symbiodinium microadriaticum]|uniref:Putative sulfate transporter YbaR n=1 Tax=Symbiodinium microadriaticum TaxID=2951 RepID=A0A1Q9C3V0_SYMMI|nr:putative sulfate transporter YbaR [Symbiodinium microadriaticum]CAE7346412.1 ybaR [Symbiodinium sp. KB8]